MTEYNKSYKVKVNQFEFSFTEEQVAAADIRQVTDEHFHLIYKSAGVNGQLLESSDQLNKQSWELDGERYDIEIKDELYLMLESMGFGKSTGKQIKEIKAPMPGLVLEISVNEEQEVAEGDKLLILVAMKMENSIQIHTQAKIKKIHVEVGQAVEKGHVLIELY